MVGNKSQQVLGFVATSRRRSSGKQDDEGGGDGDGEGVAGSSRLEGRAGDDQVPNKRRRMGEPGDAAMQSQSQVVEDIDLTRNSTSPEPEVGRASPFKAPQGALKAGSKSPAANLKGSASPSIIAPEDDVVIHDPADYGRSMGWQVKKTHLQAVKNGDFVSESVIDFALQHLKDRYPDKFTFVPFHFWPALRDNYEPHEAAFDLGKLRKHIHSSLPALITDMRAHRHVLLMCNEPFKKHWVGVMIDDFDALVHDDGGEGDGRTCTVTLVDSLPGILANLTGPKEGKGVIEGTVMGFVKSLARLAREGREAVKQPVWREARVAQQGSIPNCSFFVITTATVWCMHGNAFSKVLDGGFLRQNVFRKAAESMRNKVHRQLLEAYRRRAGISEPGDATKEALTLEQEYTELLFIPRRPAPPSGEINQLHLPGGAGGAERRVVSAPQTGYEHPFLKKERPRPRTIFQKRQEEEQARREEEEMRRYARSSQHERLRSSDHDSDFEIVDPDAGRRGPLASASANGGGGSQRNVSIVLQIPSSSSSSSSSPSHRDRDLMGPPMGRPEGDVVTIDDDDSPPPNSTARVGAVRRGVRGGGGMSRLLHQATQAAASDAAAPRGAAVRRNPTPGGAGLKGAIMRGAAPLPTPPPTLVLRGASVESDEKQQQPANGTRAVLGGGRANGAPPPPPPPPSALPFVPPGAAPTGSGAGTSRVSLSHLKKKVVAAPLPERERDPEPEPEDSAERDVELLLRDSGRGARELLVAVLEGMDSEERRRVVRDVLGR